MSGKIIEFTVFFLCC